MLGACGLQMWPDVRFSPVRWYRRRKDIGFERYIDDVTRIELELLELHRGQRLDAAAALEIEQCLTQLKSDALEQFSAGAIRGDELMNGFLTHVSDVRNCLHYLSCPLTSNCPTRSASGNMPRT